MLASAIARCSNRPVAVYISVELQRLQRLQLGAPRKRAVRSSNLCPGHRRRRCR
jgi:hypothetical protein